MKLELVCEDILLEYVRLLLDGANNPVSEYSRYFDQLPLHIDFSEDFLQSWRNIVTEVIHKFIADSFSLYSFAFAPDGYVKNLGITDELFWDTIELKFSHRSALRLYEKMLESSHKQPPSYLVALPADALFISVATGNFNEYPYPWLLKNRANWAVVALFLIWQPVHADNVAWKSCFDNPELVDLPLRALLLQRAALYFSCFNHLLRRRMNNLAAGGSEFIKSLTNKKAGAMHFNFVFSYQIAQAVAYAGSFARSVKSAFQYWTSEGTLALDDDRYLRGIFNNCGLVNEMRDFETVLAEYQSTIDLEDNIDESVIFN